MDEKGEFHLTAENIMMPDGKIYAPGALRKDYLPANSKFITGLEMGEEISCLSSQMLVIKSLPSMRVGKRKLV